MSSVIKDLPIQPIKKQILNIKQAEKIENTFDRGTIKLEDIAPNECAIYTIKLNQIKTNVIYSIKASPNYSLYHHLIDIVDGQFKIFVNNPSDLTRALEIYYLAY